MALSWPEQPPAPAMSAIERDGVDLDGGDPDDTDGDARAGEPRGQRIWTTRHPTDATLYGSVDMYCLRPKDCVARFGDKPVTYAWLLDAQEAGEGKRGELL